MVNQIVGKVVAVFQVRARRGVERDISVVRSGRGYRWPDRATPPG